MNVPTILDVVSKDAMTYFALISAPHLLIVIMRYAARVGFFSPVLVFNKSPN